MLVFEASVHDIAGLVPLIGLTLLATFQYMTKGHTGYRVAQSIGLVFINFFLVSELFEIACNEAIVTRTSEIWWFFAALIINLALMVILKRKELVETKNQAENLAFSLEKMLKDSGDKISAEDKEKLQKAIDEARKEFETDDIEKLRAAIDKLSKENEPIITKMYQQAAAEAQKQNEQKKDDEVIVEDPKDKKEDK